MTCPIGTSLYRTRAPRLLLCMDLSSDGCALLEQAPPGDAQCWTPFSERLHYSLGFHNACYSGGGQGARGALFASYATRLSETFVGLFDMPMREAWAEANELVEGPDVEWEYRRAGSVESNTYHERLRGPADPVSGRTLYTARGSC